MNLIVAVDENWAIGKGGDQLVYIKADLKRFRELTTGHGVILGRKTLATFPGGRPLKNRRNLILSATPGYTVEGAEVYADHDISRWEGIRRLCYAPVSINSRDIPLTVTPKDKLLLIELPVGKRVDYLERCVYNLNANGIRVLIAHIERCWDAEWVIRKTNHLDAYYQVNADTVMRFGGRRLFSRLLQSTGRMIISSDMHNADRRPCIMEPCREILERKFGRTVAEAVLCHGARAALGLSNGLV